MNRPTEFDPEPDPLDVVDPQLLIEAEGEGRADRVDAEDGGR